VRRNGSYPALYPQVWLGYETGGNASYIALIEILLDGAAGHAHDVGRSSPFTVMTRAPHYCTSTTPSSRAQGSGGAKHLKIPHEP